MRKIDPTRLFARDTHPELPLDPDVVKPGAYKWPPHFTLSLIVTVFVGGCFGAAARYWASIQLPTMSNGWPLGTLFVNLLGAFLLGFLLEGLVRLGADNGVRRITRLGIGTGFMGAFTTYSTFAVDADIMLRQGHETLAVWYVAVSVIGGLLFSMLGIQIAAIHHRRKGSKR